MSLWAADGNFYLSTEGMLSLAAVICALFDLCIRADRLTAGQNMLLSTGFPWMLQVSMSRIDVMS